MLEQTSAAQSASARRAAAWSVHLLTASGAIWGLLALHAIHGSRLRTALLCMATALLVDGLDGYLARRVDVAHVLPRLDGALLDNLVDYLNYVVVPAFLIQNASLLPRGTELVAAALICVASAFQFSQADAKTVDHSFKGFPSYWNFVAFYLLLLRPPPWLALASLFMLGALVFVPLLYVHPTRTRPLRRLTLSLTGLWGLALGALLLQYPAPQRWLAWASLLYPAYYGAVSLKLTLDSRS